MKKLYQGPNIQSFAFAIKGIISAVASKGVYYLGVFIGSIIGAYIPTLWGAGLLSLSSLILSTIGAILGFVFVWKLFS